MILDGVALSPGVARGAAATIRTAPRTESAPAPANGRTPREQFTDACRAAESELRQLLAALPAQDAAARQIVRAHLTFVADPMLAAEVDAGIDGGLPAPAALERAASALVARFEAFSNPALRSRAADLRDVCSCIARHLGGHGSAACALSEPRVVCATDLSPAQVVQLALQRPLAFVLEDGVDASHAAILMRALGVPAVIRVPGATTLVRDGDLVIVDGDRGQVTLRPDHSAIQSSGPSAPTEPLEADPDPARTRDGIVVAVTASIGDADGARRAMAAGADGIGLFRTEWLFVAGDVAPSEGDQVAVYEAVADAVGPRCLTVRTFDLGGDKQAPHLQLRAEPNPALGLRGVRLSFARPDLLRTQLRALLRTCCSRRRGLRLLLPMVTDISDVARMRSAIVDAIGEGSLAIGPDAFAIGIMVETPAAALMADELAAVVDFISIGTNDLPQYVLAADRENAAVAAAYQPLHPAVLRLVRRTTLEAVRCGKPVGICGEMAANPLAIPLFVGLGAAELTVDPGAVRCVKRLIRGISIEQARALADEVLSLPTAAAVLRCLQSVQPQVEDDVRAPRAAR